MHNFNEYLPYALLELECCWINTPFIFIFLLLSIEKFLADG